MRISAIAPVDRSMSSPVDPISWFEASHGVRAIQLSPPIMRDDFQRVLCALHEEEAHARRTRVLEVVSAPGVPAGLIRYHGKGWGRK